MLKNTLENVVKKTHVGSTNVIENEIVGSRFKHLLVQELTQQLATGGMSPSELSKGRRPASKCKDNNDNGNLVSILEFERN